MLLSEGQILSAKFIAYADHWRTAETLQGLADQNPNEANDLLVASIVFRAFALEAFLFHLGETLSLGSGAFENEPTIEKLKTLAKQLNVDLEMSSAGWRLLHKLLKARNQVAHAKDDELCTRIPRPANHDDPEALAAFQSDWQRFANKGNSKEIREYLGRVMLNLWTAAGHMPESLFARGIQYWRSEPC